MGCESFNVVRFDHGPLLQGQTRIAKVKMLITHLLLVLEVCNVKPTSSWAANLLIWSDLTLGPSFKVLLLKNVVYLRNYVSWPFPVDTPCIWPQMRPWSSCIIVCTIENILVDCNHYI